MTDRVTATLTYLALLTLFLASLKTLAHYQIGGNGYRWQAECICRVSITIRFGLSADCAAVRPGRNHRKSLLEGLRANANPRPPPACDGDLHVSDGDARGDCQGLLLATSRDAALVVKLLVLVMHLTGWQKGARGEVLVGACYL